MPKILDDAHVGESLVETWLLGEISSGLVFPLLRGVVDVELDEDGPDEARGETFCGVAAAGFEVGVLGDVGEDNHLIYLLCQCHLSSSMFFTVMESTVPSCRFASWNHFWISARPFFRWASLVALGLGVWVFVLEFIFTSSVQGVSLFVVCYSVHGV